MQLDKNIIRISLLYLIFSGCFHVGYKAILVEGNSMQPTLVDGQRIFINKMYFKINDPEIFDEVIFHDREEGGSLVKRIIGVPGDTVEIRNGDIYINDQILRDNFSHLKINYLLADINGDILRDWVTGEEVKENANEKKITLKKNQYWVIGDNREISWYGIINIKDIIGKV